MKKYLILSAVILPCIYAETHKNVGLSYFDTASLSFVPLTRKYHGADNSSIKSSRKKIGIEVSTAFTSSYNAEARAAYFSPVDKKELIVKESVDVNVNPQIDQGAQDILSYNFNVVTQNGNFESILSFSPVKRAWSGNINIHAQLNEQWWLFGSVPCMYMETDMQLTEKIIQDGGGAANDLTNFNIGNISQFGSMKEAFASRVMKYGRIDGKRKKPGFSDCVVKIGREHTNNAEGYVRPFVGIIIPSSNKPTAEYMFEPILGNGKFSGIMFGSEYGNELVSSVTRTISLDGVMQMTYLLPRHQIRSFDPGGKPWGRYMAMFANATDMANTLYSFGINECTKRAKVYPGIQFVSQATFSVRRHEHCIKLGYQTTVRASEQVEIPEDWSTPAIASIFLAEAQTNPARGINNLLNDFKDDSYRGIQKNEINMHSATHPFYIAHQLQVSYTRACEKNGKRWLMECGMMASCGTTNAVPYEWGVHATATCCL